jgi:hypothetical protein
MRDARVQAFESVLDTAMGWPGEKTRRLGIAAVVSKNNRSVFEMGLPQVKPLCVNDLGEEQDGPLFL